jgi:hypothetical protein
MSTNHAFLVDNNKTRFFMNVNLNTVNIDSKRYLTKKIMRLWHTRCLYSIVSDREPQPQRARGSYDYSINILQGGKQKRCNSICRG